MRVRVPMFGLCCIVAFAGCEAPQSAECPAVDAGTDVGSDAFSCTTRVVLGPLIIDPNNGALAGVGMPCSDFEPLEFRVRVFSVGGRLFPTLHGLIAERVVSCGSGSGYLDIGDLPPGEYDVAIESEMSNGNGGHLLVGADLIRPGSCTDDGGGRYYFCWPIRVTVAPCGLAVFPAALACEDPSLICVATP